MCCVFSPTPSLPWSGRGHLRNNLSEQRKEIHWVELSQRKEWAGGSKTSQVNGRGVRGIAYNHIFISLKSRPSLKINGMFTGVIFFFLAAHKITIHPKVKGIGDSENCYQAKKAYSMPEAAALGVSSHMSSSILYNPRRRVLLSSSLQGKKLRPG